MIYENGAEVHFQIEKRGKRAEGRFQHSWTGFNNRVFTIVAFASPPLKARPGFRQFQLLIDGLKFTSFPKIYELSNELRSGCRRVGGGVGGIGIGIGHSAFTSSQSLEQRGDHDNTRHVYNSTSRTGHRSSSNFNKSSATKHVDLRVSPTATAATTSTFTESLMDMELTSPMSTNSNAMSALTAADVSTMHYHHNTTTNSNTTPGSTSTSMYNNPPSQPPSYESVWNNIMDAYDTNDNGENNSSHHHSNVQDHHIQASSDFNMNVNSNNNNNNNNNALSVNTDINRYNDATKNLVNLDDITFKGYTKDMHAKKHAPQQQRKSLAQLKYGNQDTNNNTNTCNNTGSMHPTKEIMKTHHHHHHHHQNVMGAQQFDQSQSLVVYGQGHQSFNNHNSYNSYNVPPPALYGSSYTSY